MQNSSFKKSQYDKRICVVTQKDSLYSGLGHMVVETLRGMSFFSELILSDDISNVDADIFLFICDILHLERFEAQIKNLPGKKPVIALWYLEPLGPDNVSESALKNAAVLGCCDWPDILTENLPFLKKLIPSRVPGRKPHKGFMLSVLRFILSMRVKKQMINSLGYECPNIDSRDIYYMSYRYELFRRNFQRPWVDFVFVGTHSKQRLLEKAKISTTYVRVGHHSDWGYSMSLQRDIDVVFLGHLHKKGCRRIAVLKYLKERLEANGYKLKIVNKNC